MNQRQAPAGKQPPARKRHTANDRAAALKQGRSLEPGLHEPGVGWRQGLERLVLRGRCPWCNHPAAEITLSHTALGNVLSWDCLEGCNP